MSSEKLAILGGRKIIEKPFERYNSIGNEELHAVQEVIKTGVLSRYLGRWSEDFFGGQKVREFERNCEEFFETKHAISVNSWTSGLMAIVGAIGIEPGDEVIVTPWTMCASATAILNWNAIPVFADIEPETFCIDPVSVEKNITPYTKAIMSVDIFGHSANIDSLMEIGEKYNLTVISDAAQAPGALYRGKKVGAQTHVGGYSLNCHKHIQTGEGGIIVTNDDVIAERARLIRNHAEAVVGDQEGNQNLCNMLGYNFRLGEIECAIGIEQLKKLENFVSRRQQIAARLSNGLQLLDGLKIPKIMPQCTHAFYIYPMVLDIELLGVSRKRVVEALAAEGVEGLANGYINVHLLPMYQKKMAYGSRGFPWSADFCQREVSYEKGICPVAEELQDKTFVGFEMCRHNLSNEEVDLIVAAFQKVWGQIRSL